MRQDQCPAVANYDLAKIKTFLRRGATPYQPDPSLEEVRVPAWASRRPPPDATFIVRVRLPPGGGYAQDERAVVWREADGSWWGWRTVLNDPDRSLPPAPPASGSPEEAAWKKEQAAEAAAGYEILYSSETIYEGRLDDRQSAMLEGAYSDPCRKLEPDAWPRKIPLLNAEKGRRVHDCQVFQDSTIYIAEFTEDARGPRNISLPCGSAGTLNGVLVTWSAHAEPPKQPARRLTHEEIDKIKRR